MQYVLSPDARLVGWFGWWVGLVWLVGLVWFVWSVGQSEIWVDNWRGVQNSSLEGEA